MASGGERRTEPQDRAAALFGRLIERARLTLGWERLWPGLAPGLGVVGLFVAVSWLGLFEGLPGWLRWAIVLLFALALCAALLPLSRLRLPSRREALARLDRETGLAHRPASSLADRLATQGADPVSRALWAAHQRDAEAKARSLRLGPPRPAFRGSTATACASPSS